MVVRINEKFSPKQLGQFFTPSDVAEFMVSLISNVDRQAVRVLEPCAGHGVFLRVLKEEGFRNVTAYELDRNLENEAGLMIIYQDFLSTDPSTKYDVIIGNPPYVRWKNLPQAFRDSFRKNPYLSETVNGLGDLLYAFLQSCVEKLSERGELIFITPVFWTQTLHARMIRRTISKVAHMDEILTFNEMKIFGGVSSSLMIFKLSKARSKNPIKIIHIESKGKLSAEILSHTKLLLKRLDMQDYIKEGIFEAYLHPQFVNGNSWSLIPPETSRLLDLMESTCTSNSPVVCLDEVSRPKFPMSALLERNDVEYFRIPENALSSVRFAGHRYFVRTTSGRSLLSDSELRPLRLGDVADIGNGLVSGLDRAFKVEDASAVPENERSKLIPVIKAGSLRKYVVGRPTPYIFVNDVRTEEELRVQYPVIYRTLARNKTQLAKRFQYNTRIPWWHWVFLRNFDLISQSNEKILAPCKERIDTKEYARFSLALGKYYATQDVTVIVKKKHVREDVRYFLGVLNSRLVLNWLKYKGVRRGGVLEFSERPLASIPMRLINWEDQRDVSMHNEVVEHVENILGEGKPEPHSDKIETIVSELYGVN